MGLALEGFDTKDEMLAHAMDTAGQIASKSPLTIRGIKKVSVYTRDHSTDDALEHVGMHHAANL